MRELRCKKNRVRIRTHIHAIQVHYRTHTQLHMLCACVWCLRVAENLLRLPTSIAADFSERREHQRTAQQNRELRAREEKSASDKSILDKAHKIPSIYHMYIDISQCIIYTPHTHTHTYSETDHVTLLLNISCTGFSALFCRRCRRHSHEGDSRSLRTHNNKRSPTKLAHLKFVSGHAAVFAFATR